MGGGRWAAAALALAVLLAGCSDDSATSSSQPTASRLAADCAAAVDSILTTTQGYLGSIDAANASASPGPTPSPAEDDLASVQAEYQRAVSDVQAYAASLGCDPREFAADVAEGLRELRAGGPVARAVLLQIRSQADPVPSGPVPPGSDLALAVAAAEPGATVQLSAGEYVVDETLTLLRGVKLVGAGRDATTLRSSAAEGTVLVLTADDVTLEALTLTRGDAPGSVVSAAPTASLSVVDARISGARSVPEGGGGVGVLMSAGAGGQLGATRRTTLRMSGSELVDNAVAGLVVAGEHRVDVAGSSFVRDGTCGVCFLDTADGVLADSAFDGSSAGVVVSGSARPVIRGGSVAGGEVGLQVLEGAAPDFDGVAVRGSSRAAVLFGDRATGSARRLTCSEVPYGIVVGPQAAPTLEDNDCQLARGQ